MTNVFGFIMSAYHSGFSLRFALQTIHYCNLHIGAFLDKMLMEIG